ncbi:sugar phosphate isomerase/epimerase family protein [Larkinella rosea]|uniref:Sugar phosphate isomerase/epimerase n=1 Tax=Larkinella rosea TaxID=2025312 RepID=A0A3P1BET2_9BACT|nr:sugar phosphate isomerase/epimerase family protein [Larkinella rosea]RRA99163.1 sugar phosphate isomerase/epimerase [Larkinella rosea]
MAANYSRRSFIQKTALVTGALSLLQPDRLQSQPTQELAIPKMHLFSKHLQFLNYTDLAEKAAELGFDGVDLTVRPNGHVRPERVETDLPKAVEALKKVGFSPSLMTTAVEDAANPVDHRVLETAAQLGIRHYRMNWYWYPADRSLPESLRQYQQKVKGLSELNQKLNLTGGYQNHSGSLVGASAWEVWEMLKTADPETMGVQYDIRHATVEGGLSWQNGLRLLQSHIKTLVFQDFAWENRAGKWVVKNVPIGEGMSDYKNYFQLLKQYKIQVSASFHSEHTPGGDGATKLPLSDQKVAFESLKKELKRVKELWQQA